MANSTLKLSMATGLLLLAKLGMAQTTPITTVGIIGSATANGWNTSTPMTQTTATSHIWRITLPLMVGEAKFRANDAWTINWGAAAFPTGTGVQDGANIPITTAGTWYVQLNDQTGAYQFSTTPLATRTAGTTALRLSLAPNPTHDYLTLNYELPLAAKVAVTVLNPLGQQVRQFDPSQQAAGTQIQALPLRNLASGVYLVKLQANDQVQTARLVVN